MEKYSSVYSILEKNIKQPLLTEDSLEDLRPDIRLFYKGLNYAMAKVDPSNALPRFRFPLKKPSSVLPSSDGDFATTSSGNKPESNKSESNNSREEEIAAQDSYPPDEDVSSAPLMDHLTSIYKGLVSINLTLSKSTVTGDHVASLLVLHEETTRMAMKIRKHLQPGSGELLPPTACNQACDEEIRQMLTAISNVLELFARHISVQGKNQLPFRPLQAPYCGLPPFGLSAPHQLSFPPFDRPVLYPLISLQFPHGIILPSSPSPPFILQRTNLPQPSRFSSLERNYQ